MSQSHSGLHLTLGLMALSLFGCAGGPNEPDDVVPIPVVLAEGDSRFPDQTATDWVTYADYVVVATPVKEAVIEPDMGAASEGPPSMITRELVIRVDSVIWSSNDPARPVPDTFSWPALGWDVEDDGSRGAPMSARNTSRIEVEHRYVMALRWEPPRCSTGDRRIAGRWVGLGGQAVIPFDEPGQLGSGEFQGNPGTYEDLKDVEGSAGATLREVVMGKKLGVLVQELKEAVPVSVDPGLLEAPAPC